MNFFIKDYHRPACIAKIINRESLNTQINNDYEYLIIGKLTSSFTTDKLTVNNQTISKLNELHTGDVVYIDNKGVGFRLFSSLENDATIYLTGHCNSNCIMCPCSDNERKESSGLEDEFLLKYLKMLPDNLGHIVVTGGEPTLRLDMFIQVMKYISKRFANVATLLLTNGRSFSYNKLADFLAQYHSQQFQVGIPVHGHNANLHDNITRAVNSFIQTDKGIKNLLQRKINVELRVVVTRLNVEYLENMAQVIVNEYPTVKVVNFLGLETRGNCALNFKKVYVDHKNAFMGMKFAIDILLASGIEVGIYNFPLCYVDSGYWKLCKKSISPEKVRYAQECNCCYLKNTCGGFFDTTLSLVKPKVYPCKF